jgi:hypothetical protein
MMTTPAGIDVDVPAEYEMAKENVVFLERVLRVAKQKEDSKLAISGAQTEIDSLATKLEATKTELGTMKVTLAKEEMDHKAKTMAWKEKDSKLEHVLFQAESLSETSSDNGEDLEELARLAEENAALFKQKLTIRHLKIAIKAKIPEIEGLETSLSKQEELHSFWSRMLRGFTLSHHERLQKYRQKLERDLNSNSVVTSLHAQVESFTADILRKEAIIKDQTHKIASLEATINSNNELIHSKQAIVIPCRSKVEIPAVPQNRDKSMESQLMDAYQRGRHAVFNLLIPLALAGRFIRSRKLEWEKTAKDQKLVELGNKAAHYGMALADAILYQPFCPDQRKDPDLYIECYGLHPDFVWKNQECTLLLEILGWRGAMRNFYPPNAHNRTPYGRTSFCALCHTFVDMINKDESAWSVKTLNEHLQEGGKGFQMYNDLKAQHATGMKVREAYLKAK